MDRGSSDPAAARQFRASRTGSRIDIRAARGMCWTHNPYHQPNTPQYSCRAATGRATAGNPEPKASHRESGRRRGRRTAGNLRDMAVNLNNLGTVAHLQNRYDQAVPYYEQAVALARSINNDYATAMPSGNLGMVAMQRGEYELAAPILDESIRLFRSVGYEQKLAVMLGNRGNLSYRQEKYDEAATIQEEALSRKRRIGDRLAVAHSLGDLGLTEIERGDIERAAELLTEALDIFYDAGQMDGVVQAIEALARIAQHRNELERATRLYGGAATLRAEIGVTHHPADLPRHEASLEALRAAMDPSGFEAAWAIGHATSVLQLIDETIPSQRQTEDSSVRGRSL